MVEYGLVSLVGWPMGCLLGSPPCYAGHYLRLVEYGLVSLVGWPMVGWLVCSGLETLVPSSDRSLRFGGGCRSLFGNGGVRSSEPVGTFRRPDRLFQRGGKRPLLERPFLSSRSKGASIGGQVLA